VARGWPPPRCGLWTASSPSAPSFFGLSGPGRHDALVLPTRRAGRHDFLHPLGAALFPVSSLLPTRCR
jgi:hypothetical protein